MLDPKQLHALAAVAAEGSFARAAKRLGTIGQSELVSSFEL